MKEFFSIMASAWSVAFIMLAFILLTDVRSLEIPFISVFCIAGAITGSGWLVYRHEINSDRRRAADENTRGESK